MLGLLVVAAHEALVHFPLLGRVALVPLRATLESELGGAVAIERLSILASGVELNDLRFTPAAGADGTPTWSVSRARLSFDWWSLLGSAPPRLARLELENVEVVLPEAADETSGGLPRLTWALFDSGIEVLEIRNLSVSAAAGGGRALRLERADLHGARRAGELSLELSSPALWLDAEQLGTLRLTATASRSALQIALLELKTTGARVRAEGVVDWARVRQPQLELSGLLELHATPLRRTLAVVAEPLTLGRVVDAGRASASFELYGPLKDPTRWLGRGHLSLSRPRAVAPDGRVEVQLESLSVEVQRSASGLRLTRLRARGDAIDAQAELDLPRGGGHQLSATLNLAGIQALRRLAPDVPLLLGLRDAPNRPPATIRVDVDARGTAEGTQVTGTLVAGNLRLEATSSAPALSVDQLEAHFDYRIDDARLTLETLRLRTPAGTLRGRGTVAGGQHHLELRGQKLDVRALDGWLPGRARQGSVSGRFVLDGTADDPFRRVRADLTLRDVTWQPPPGSVAGLRLLELRRGEARMTHDGRGLRVESFALEGSAPLAVEGPPRQEPASVALRGRASFRRGAHHLDLKLERLDARLLGAVVGGDLQRGTLRGRVVIDGNAAAPVTRLSGNLELDGLEGALLRSVLPRALKGGTLSARVVVDGDAADALRHIAGTLELSHASFRPGPPWPGRVELRRASANLLRDGQSWELSDVALETNVGTVHGSVRGNEEGHRGVARWELSDAAELEALLPGRVESGALRVTADVSGTADDPFARVIGRLELGGVRWLAPAAAELCRKSIRVRQATADYLWSAGQLRVSDARIEAEAFHAGGNLSWRSGVTALDAELSTTRAHEVIGLFPALSGVAEGGHGRARISVQASALGTSGRIDGHVDDAVLALTEPGSSERTRHPVRRVTFGYDFGPDGSRLRALRLRGPELNVDVEARWSDAGPVLGAGRLWLTREYTQEVTNGARWALRLLGYPRIETEFTLQGTRRDVRMDAAIAHGWRWALLRIATPDRLEQVARGRLPLFRYDSSLARRCAR